MSKWEPVVGVVLGIPAIAFAVRMVIRSIADGLVRIKGGASAPLEATVRAQERRLAQLEAEIAALREDVVRLSAVERFYAQLQAPAATREPAGPP